MDGTSVTTETGKIFVGGLSWDTTKEGLTNHFEHFGTVSDAVIMVDADTRKPRGFGFVTFSDQDSVTKVMASGPHILDGKTVDPKPAIVKGHQMGMGGMGGQSGTAGREKKKLFVGGLAAGTTEDDVKKCFEDLCNKELGGKVTSVELKYDKNTSRMRGFGFVGFDSDAIVDKACLIHYHQINGKTAECKHVVPQGQTVSASGQQAYVTSYPQQGYQLGAANYGRGAQYNNYAGYASGYPSHYHTQAAAQQQYGYGTYPYYPTAAAAGGQQATAASLPTQQMGSYNQDTTSYSTRGYTPSESAAYGGQSAYNYSTSQVAQAVAASAYQQSTANAYQQSTASAYQQPSASAYQQPSASVYQQSSYGDSSAAAVAAAASTYKSMGHQRQQGLY